MAEALLNLVLENLSSFALNELSTFCGVNREIERLSKTLPLIKAVIEDAEVKQITEDSIRDWLQDLKDAAHVLDDILDECSIESLRRADEAQNSRSANQVHCVSLSSFKPKKIWSRYQLGKKLKEVRERIDQIAKEKKKFRLLEHEGIKETPTEVPEGRQTTSIMAPPRVYGRDEDKEKIVEFLVRQTCDNNNLSVYSIVGIGGLGKTTLAQLVFNDQRVSKHFNLKIWVCVSDDFAVAKLLRSIIQSITGQEDSTSNLDAMAKKVQEQLQSKRYLLVLDDVWNENQDRWDQLKSVLSCGSNGASVLVTTRNTNVASIMTPDPAHILKLKVLSDHDCWSLFRERAFTPDKEGRAELVAIGKEIVRKCGGLPLAAKALGSLVRFKSGEEQWREVKDSKLWNLPDEKSILPALRLSYFGLTPKSRRCFAFCAIFPKDEEIMKEDLIHLWMANGFISSRENLDVEDVGDEVWNELYHKSFFQNVIISYGGNAYFKMHDLVHDLAQSVMEKECLVLENGRTAEYSRSTQHINLCDFDRSFNKKDFKKAESLRTLLFSRFTEVPRWFPTHRSLRVLKTNALPSLDHLIHLRYVELLYAKTDALPKSICSLQKLEILKLNWCDALRHLPEELTCLRNLRHLIIIGCFSLSRMPPNIRKLSCLRTLSVFIVGSETRHSLAELRDLKLGGELRIRGLENVTSVSEAKQANLIGKKNLQQLSLSWDESDETKSHGADAQQVIEALQPHSELKDLTLYGYKGSYFPIWMGDNSIFSKLVSLTLVECKNCRQLPPLGKLPSLKELRLCGMQHVRYMDEQNYDGVEMRAFVSLETLELDRMPNLGRLLRVEEGEMFPRLSWFEIKDCPKLKLPSLPSLETLSIEPCEEELLRSISSFHGLSSLYLRTSEVTSLPEGMMRNFTGLKSLVILNFQKLKELPSQLTSLHALEHLFITGCYELESIPEQALEGLSSLRELKIWYCKRLMCLPRSVGHLNSLERLQIFGCPILEERCKEGTGEDWPKIAHIPRLRIG